MESGNVQDLSWQDYETVTKYIYEMLGVQYGIKVISFGKNSKVKGKSGIMHQVDVLTEELVQGRAHRTAIECKFRKKKVTKETVMTLHSIMVDADIAGGIIVCKAGYTPDTLTYAEHLGIKLVELREVGDDREVNIGTLETDIKFTITRSKIVSIDLGSIQIIDENELMKMFFPGYAIIRTPDGREIPFDKYLNAYCNELADRDQLLKTITINYPSVEGKLIRRGQSEQSDIQKISFAGFRHKIDKSSKRSFEIVDQVWMVMKEIFEKQTFVISEGGLVYQTFDNKA